MITVTKFEVSSDRLSMNLNVSVGVGETVTSITLWTDSTYKSNTASIDLSSLISGATNEEDITITASQMQETPLDGIYFCEIESSDVADVPGIVATLSLTRFYTVIAQLTANVDLSCLNCNPNFQNALLLDLYVQAMVNSIRLGRFQDAIQHLNKINIFNDYECAECAQISPVVSTAGNIVSVGVIDCTLNL
tara:strand:+ start:2768 stop:3343 length:576 start_codon:yes stop_codon:yes gene_type:complete